MPPSQTDGQNVIDGMVAWLSHSWFILVTFAAGIARVENFGMRIKRTEEHANVLDQLVRGQAETNERLARMEGRLEGLRK